MKWLNFLFTIFTFLPAYDINAQMFLKIVKQPGEYESLYDTIRFPSGLNGWDPSAKLDSDQPGVFRLPDFSGILEYKACRGTWLSVEGSSTGGEIPNRKITFKAGDTVSISIDSWKDWYSSSTHTATKQVYLLKSDFPMTPFNKKRRVWIYLPDDYDSSAKSYPTLYLHDGQNLFDRALSFAGEWQVDEAMQNYAKQGIKDCIVIGIDNGGNDRIDEYTPYINPKYGGGNGEKYAEFLVNTLKPFIDRHFRTLTEPEHTGIAGSSLGGLISYFTAIRYPNVFGRVGVFSPSFWYSDSLMADVKKFVPQSYQKFYFVAGANEDEDMVPDIDKYITMMKQQGMTESQIQKVIRQDGKHSEWFWAREFPMAYYWLDLWGELSEVSAYTTEQNYITVIDSPSTRPTIKISDNLPVTAHLAIINASSGKVEMSLKVKHGDVVVCNELINPQVYIAKIIGNGVNQSVKFLKIN